MHVGKLYGREVDFVAIKDGERRYIQVTEAMDDERVQERELAPLCSIPDVFPKMVVARRSANVTDVDGVQIINARNFFLPG